MIKIFLAVSTVANLVLIATVVGILPFLLTLSGVIIVLLLWYIKKSTAETKEITQDFDSFYLKLEQYEKHINDIHGLEMFYGDETLQGLIKHSREILNHIYDFQVKYFIEGDEEDFDTEETQSEEKEPLLYRGTSESDS
tara:strand:- start:1768 stop:2184 length:417 start_codon:yes stop_codon:yes gene_type:complete